MKTIIFAVLTILSVQRESIDDKRIHKSELMSYSQEV